MTARQRLAHTDPVDRPESYQIAVPEVTAKQRARARLQVTLATEGDIAERRDLLAALGLDDRTEMTAQLVHRSNPMIPTPEHPAVAAYEEAICGIPDSFDCITAQTIRDYADWSNVPLAKAHEKAAPFVRSFFAMLDTWRDALDELDSELRSHVTAGGLPEDHALYLKLQALGLFTATTALQRAALEYHYGVAGPELSTDYGHAYQLSNSALSPF
jgi:hypothetical protein